MAFRAREFAATTRTVSDETVLYRCTGIGNAVKYCFEDEDCQQDGDEGWCVREFERGQAPTRNICRDREAPFPPPAEMDIPDCPYRDDERAPRQTQKR